MKVAQGAQKEAIGVSALLAGLILNEVVHHTDTF